MLILIQQPEIKTVYQIKCWNIDPLSPPPAVENLCYDQNYVLNLDFSPVTSPLSPCYYICPT